MGWQKENLILKFLFVSRYANFDDIRSGNNLQDFTIDVLRRPTLLSCAFSCLLNPKCRSLNFCGKNCLLSSKDAISHPSKLSLVYNCVYIGMKSETYPNCSSFVMEFPSTLLENCNLGKSNGQILNNDKTVFSHFWKFLFFEKIDLPN